MSTVRFNVAFPELLDGTHACRDEDPDLFFPPESADGAAAKQVCAVCPILRDCLAYALTHAVEGVWGGTTTAERRSLRRRHDIAITPYAYAGSPR